VITPQGSGRALRRLSPRRQICDHARGPGFWYGERLMKYTRGA
jgi:hypothetical protein